MPQENPFGILIQIVLRQKIKKRKDEREGEWSREGEEGRRGEEKRKEKREMK